MSTCWAALRKPSLSLFSHSHKGTLLVRRAKKNQAVFDVPLMIHFNCQLITLRKITLSNNNKKEMK